MRREFLGPATMLRIDNETEDPEVIEVEIEEGFSEVPRAEPAGTWGRAVGPVVAGLIIDVLDMATFGATGLYLGFILGAPAGWYLARHLGLDSRQATIGALACGIYCTIPLTAPIPVAALLGLWARARTSA